MRIIACTLFDFTISIRYNRNLKKRLFRSLIIASLLLNAAAAAAQAPPRKTMSAVPAGGPIKIDGVLSEPVWQTPGSGGFTQRDPSTAQPADRNDDRLDRLRRATTSTSPPGCHDSEPDKIVGRLGRRDDFVESDWFYVGVDPYLDRRSGYYFGVNPSGSIEDGTLFNDERDRRDLGRHLGERRPDRRPGLGGRDAHPLRPAPFKSRDVYVWGVNFQRIIKRKNEEDYFAWVPKEESGLVSRFADLDGRPRTSPRAGASRSRPSPLAQADVQPGRARQSRSAPAGAPARQRRLRPQGRPEQQPDPRRSPSIPTSARSRSIRPSSTSATRRPTTRRSGRSSSRASSIFNFRPRRRQRQPGIFGWTIRPSSTAAASAGRPRDGHAGPAIRRHARTGRRSWARPR